MYSPKKILQINTVCASGSTGWIVEKNGHSAIIHGWESYIAFGRWSSKSGSCLIRIGSKTNILYHVLLTRILDKHGLGSVKSTYKFINQIERINPDIIHLHNIHGYYLNIKILFKYLSKINKPIVWTFHDCWPITGHCVHFDLIGCEKWKSECSNCPQKKSYPASYFFDNSSKNFNLKQDVFNSVKNLTIVTVSEWLSETVKKSFLSKHPIKIIQNGIDLSVFKPENSEYIKEKYKINKRFIILGVASIWDERKGLNDFIKLSRDIDQDFQIILVGLKKNQVKKLPSNIIGIPKTENVKELVAFYNMADVYFNASKEETFGLTTVESMACGTPVIVYKSTACPEIVTEKTGFVIDKNDTTGLLNALVIIKENGKNYYSESCIELAKERYDISSMLNKYMELYNSVLDKVDGNN